MFNDFIRPPEPFCKRTAAAGQGIQIGFRDVVGLWVLLAGGVVGAIIIILTARAMNKSKPQLDRAVTAVRVFSENHLRQSLSPRRGAGPAADGGAGPFGSPRAGGDGMVRISVAGAERGPDVPHSKRDADARKLQPAPAGGVRALGGAADAAAGERTGNDSRLDAFEHEMRALVQRHWGAGRAPPPAPPPV